MTRLFLIAILFLICSCAAHEPLPTSLTTYEKVNIAGVEVVPATRISQLYVGMPMNDVYEILGSPSGHMGSVVLFFDLYDPKFKGKTVPHYVLFNFNGLVKQWGSSGSPDKAIDKRQFDY